MALGRLAKLISDKQPTPNKFTKAMGRLVRDAREQAGLSQADLAKTVYRRQATVSDIETGKSEVTATTLTLLAAALQKPFSYFFPRWSIKDIKPESLEPDEAEVLIQFNRIGNDQLRRIAIDQLAALARSDIKAFQEQYQRDLYEDEE
jgi:transcriptional regulator with XRE-family HTH domain